MELWVIYTIIGLFAVSLLITVVWYMYHDLMRIGIENKMVEMLPSKDQSLLIQNYQEIVSKVKRNYFLMWTAEAIIFVLWMVLYIQYQLDQLFLLIPGLIIVIIYVVLNPTSGPLMAIAWVNYIDENTPQLKVIEETKSKIYEKYIHRSNLIRSYYHHFISNDSPYLMVLEKDGFGRFKNQFIREEASNLEQWPSGIPTADKFLIITVTIAFMISTFYTLLVLLFDFIPKISPWIYGSLNIALLVAFFFVSVNISKKNDFLYKAKSVLDANEIGYNENDTQEIYYKIIEFIEENRYYIPKNEFLIP